MAGLVVHFYLIIMEGTMKKTGVAALLLLLLSWAGVASADNVMDVTVEGVLTGDKVYEFSFDLSSIASGNFQYADLYIDASQEQKGVKPSDPSVRISVNSLDEVFNGKLTDMYVYSVDPDTGLRTGWFGGLFGFDITDLLKSDFDKKIDISITVLSGEFKLLDFYAETTAVPEPATILLFGAGLAGLTACCRRKVIH